VSSTPALRIVLTTLPNAEIAGRLAHELVAAKLAACVNVLSPCRSIYRWQESGAPGSGKTSESPPEGAKSILGRPGNRLDGVQEDVEIPLIIKTTAARYPALETFLRENHPYQVPEILAIDGVDGLPDYLRWAALATQP